MLNVSTRWQQVHHATMTNVFIFVLFFLDWLNWSGLGLIGTRKYNFPLTLSVLCSSRNVVRFQFSYDKSLLFVSLLFVSFVGILLLSLYAKYIFERRVQIRVTLTPHNVTF